MAEVHCGRRTRRPAAGRKRLGSIDTTDRPVKVYDDGSASRHPGSNDERRVLMDSGNIMATEGDPVPAIKKSKSHKNGISAFQVHISPNNRSTSGGETKDIGDLWPLQVKQMLSRLPSKIVGIHENQADPFLCPECAEAVKINVQDKEKGWRFPTDFLEKHNWDKTSTARAVLVDWLIMVQGHLGLLQETLQMSVLLMDKVLSLYHIEIRKLQLLGITCLFIATKFHEIFSPEISVLVKLTDNIYVPKDIKIMEREILQITDFDIASPKLMFFLERLFLVHSHSDNIKNMAMYIVDATLININQVQFSPSMRAASALFIARKLFDCGEPWTPGLAKFTKYSEKDLLHCFELMVEVLIEAPKSIFQGARSKYSNFLKHRNISMHPCLAKLPEIQHGVSIMVKLARF